MDLPRNDHEFLESHAATGVGATVEDVHDCIVSANCILGDEVTYRERAERRASWCRPGRRCGRTEEHPSRQQRP